MDKKYFYCYSKPLKDFFIRNNLRYILRATHEKTQKQYWVFESCDKLNGLLAEWRLYRK